MTNVLVGCGVAAAAGLATGGAARAGTLFSTGFEASNVSPAAFTSTGYSHDNFVFGQGTPVAVTDAYAGTLASGSGSGTVYTYAESGITPTSTANTQYLGVSDLNGIDPGSFYSYFPNITTATAAPATPFVNIVGTLAIRPTGTAGAEFGLIAFDGTAAQNPIADIAIDSATGAVTANNFVTGVNPLPTLGTQNTAATTFESYELQINLVTGTYNVFASTTSSGTFLPTDLIAAAIPLETAGATTFSTGGFDTFSSAATGSVSGYAYADNLSITTAVPEPTSLAVLAGSVGVALTTRRRSRQAQRSM